MSLTYLTTDIILTSTSPVNNLLDATNGGFTVTLPDASNSGITLSFRRIDGVFGNTVTLQSFTGTQTIEGQSTLNFNGGWSTTLISYTGAWYYYSGSSTFNTLIYFNSGGDLSPNNFLLMGSQNSNELDTFIIMTRNLFIKNMYAGVSASPGGTDSRTFTLRQNSTNTSLAVTISGTDTTGFNGVNTVFINPFDLISIEHTVSGSPSAAVGYVSIEIG